MSRFTRTCTLLGVLGAFACNDAPTNLPSEGRDPDLRAGFDVNVIVSPSNVNGAIWTPRYDPGFSVGTGVIRPFLDMQASPNEEGFNTDNDAFLYDQHRTSDTNKLPLNYVPVINTVELGFAREIVMDANESNSAPDPQFSIDTFELYLCDTPDSAATKYNEYADFADNSADCALVYDLGGDTLLAADSTKGSGNVFDYRILIPETFFQAAADQLGTELCPYRPTTEAEADCGQYLILWAQHGFRGGNFITDATFEEYSTILRAFVDVSKTADESLTRTHLWKIIKSVDPSHHNLFPGQVDTSDYTVTVVDTGSTDSGWAVSGVITIENPSSDTVRITSVTDSISGVGTISVVCSETLPHILDDGDTLECTYSTTLTNGNSRTNFANVVLGDGGTSQATAPIDFTEATVTDVLDEVTVVDNFDEEGDETLGQDVADSATFEFPRPFTCDDIPEKQNIARIVETGQADTAVVTIACGSLAVEKTAVTSFVRRFEWSIEKSASPDTLDLFTGDEGDVDYEVDILQTGVVDSAWAVAGDIKVINTGSFTATLGAVTDTVSGIGSVTVQCGVTVAGYALAAGDTLHCTYESDLPDGDSRTNRAYATIQGNGAWGDTANVTFGAPSDTINGTVNVVDDVEGTLGEALGDTTFTYTNTFACDADEGSNRNIATITETGQADTAFVQVNCFGLTVTKTAPTQLNRRFEWEIEKDLDTEFFLAGTLILPDTAVIQENEALQAHYEITIDTTGSVDSAWAIGSGTIKVANQNPTLAALINSVADVVSPNIAAVVDCSVTFPYSLAAADTLDCTYSADLPDGTNRTDTATAVLQNHSYDAEGVGTPTGTSPYSGTALADFSTATVTEIDECVDVNDILSDTGTPVDSTDLGNYCVTQTLPHTFDVYYDFGPEDIPVECGLNEFNNTATFVTNDTESTGSDDADLNILVECEEGCTLTQGYWKTHNDSFSATKAGNGPPPDPTWDLLPGGLAENTVFFSSGMTWFQVFNTSPQGNAYYNLAHQYMAAVLNTLAGANPPANVATAIASATTLFNTFTPNQVKNFKGNNPNRQQFITLAGILGSFNEGAIGPGHCTENDVTLLR